MITKHTTQTERNDRLGGGTGSWRPMAVGLGLAVVSALLIVAVLLASRVGALPIRFSISEGAGAQPAALGIAAPISGTGSAYGGGAYGVTRPAARNPNVQVGTGLVSDGSAYMEYLIEQAARPSMEPARPTAPDTTAYYLRAQEEQAVRNFWQYTAAPDTTAYYLRGQEEQVIRALSEGAPQPDTTAYYLRGQEDQAVRDFWAHAVAPDTTAYYLRAQEEQAIRNFQQRSK